MRYLLDTHIWLWGLLEPNRISPEIIAILGNTEHEFFISPISIWETRILAERGKIELTLPPDEWISEALFRSQVKEAKLSHAVALKSRQIDLPHQDPADRFIAATAWEYGLVLITADEKLRRSQTIRVI